MDAGRNSVQAHALPAQILFDKFHRLRPLAAAMEQVRRAEYKRGAKKDRAFIKGPRYTRLAKLLPAQGGVRITLSLSPRGLGAPDFFTRWQEHLKWSRLQPVAQFAALTERHWDGTAAYGTPRNKVTLGFVEG